MKKYISLLLFLFFAVSGLSAQTDLIVVPINKIASREDIGEFFFQPDGQFIRYVRNGFGPVSRTVHEVAYPNKSDTIISESWAFVGEKGPKGVHMMKHTMRVQDSLIERTVRTVGNILYREAVYTLDEKGRPLHLKITQEKTEGEDRSYQVASLAYAWNGAAEVEIKSQEIGGANYKVKKHKRSLIIDKSAKKEWAVRLTIGYNKEEAVSSVTTTTNGTGNRLATVRRKDGSLRGGMRSVFPIGGVPAKPVWGVKKQDDFGTLTEAAIKSVNEGILEELVLKDLDYRMLFPKALDIF